MSVKTMGKVWDLKLPQNQMLVLLAMADHADHEGGSIFPGTPLIAWKAGLSEKQTQRIIKQLVASGILVEQSARPGQKKVYRIDFSKATFKEPLIRKSKRVTPPIAMSIPIAVSSLDMPSEEEGHSTLDMPSLKTDDEPSVFKPSIKDSVAPIQKVADVHPKKQRERNPIFDMVALESFGVDLTKSETVDGARVGKIVSWLATDSPNATVDTLKAFYRWYDKETKGANRPRDVVKFGEHFTKFKQSQTLKARTADQKIIDFGLSPVSDDEFEPFGVDTFMGKVAIQGDNNAA